MKTLVNALSNMLATGNEQADRSFVFYNVTLAASFLLIVLIMGDTKLLLIAIAVITGFSGVVIAWALAFYKEA